MRLAHWSLLLLVAGCARTPSVVDPPPADAHARPPVVDAPPNRGTVELAATAARIEALARSATAQALLGRTRPIHADPPEPGPRRAEPFARRVARRTAARCRALLDFHARFLDGEDARRLDLHLRRAELLLDPDPGALRVLARDLTDFALATADPDRAAEAWFLLGEVHVDRGDEEAARLAFLSVVRAHADHELAPTAHLEVAASFFSQAMFHREEPNGGPLAREYFADAGAVWSRFADRRDGHPRAEPSRLAAGNAFVWAERWQSAYDHLHPFVARDPAGLPSETAALRAEAMYWLGWAFLQIADLPPDERPARLRGMYTDDWEGAAFRQLLDLDREHPDSLWAKYARGLLVERGGVGEP